MGNTYREVLSWASSFLEKQGIEGHSILFVFLGRKNWTKTDWLRHWGEEISAKDLAQIKADLEKLAQHYPPQYLLGFEEFYGRRFQVTKDTLIPRPETEELVALCLANVTNKAVSVVDVGTGTGAIALTLKAERPNWQVCAVDLSAAALAIAKTNAQALKVEVTFYLGSILAPIQAPVDVIISNPPYISENEWAVMDESVRTYEPQMALFAENEGLAIYQQLAKEAQTKLKPAGQVFLEIGFQQGASVQAIFQQAFPTKTVTIHQDLSGQDRMIWVR